MGRSGALAAPFLLLSLAGGLSGCALADRYSGHAVVYNLEAEQAQNQALLLNVVRAYLQRPMQFTSLETITGSTSVNESASVFVPFTLFGTNATTGTFGASVTHGPSYTVPVLDTQEFYQGILSPAPGQLIDLYIQQGYPRDFLFNLFLQKIVLKRMDPECPSWRHVPWCELTFQNYVGADLNLDLFQTFVGYLIHLGLTTELLPDAPKKNSKSKDDKKSKDDNDGDDSTPTLKPYGFCFAPLINSDYVGFNRAILCGNPGNSVLAKKTKVGRTSLIEGVPMSSDIVRRLRSIARRELEFDEHGKPHDIGAHPFLHIDAFAGRQVSLAFYTRSAEGIIYYLGEVARRQLEGNPTLHQERRLVEWRYGPATSQFPLKICPFNPEVDENGYRCVELFVLERNGGAAELAVYYEGSRYSIPAGKRMNVLDFTRQVLAMNTSAKQLPASSVLRVVGAP